MFHINTEGIKFVLVREGQLETDFETGENKLQKDGTVRSVYTVIAKAEGSRLQTLKIKAPGDPIEAEELDRLFIPALVGIPYKQGDDKGDNATRLSYFAPQGVEAA